MYVFYFDDLLLPVAPGSMDTKINNQNETITLINEGEINLLKSPGLTDISFDAFIPGVKYPWAVYHYTSFWHPSNFLERFEIFKTSLKPFDFVVARKWQDGTGLNFRTNMKVTLESYTITEEAENGKDIIVEIKLKQYKPFGTKTITIQQETATATSSTTREEPAVQEVTYTIVSGDTLWGIAKRLLGDGAKWQSIYDLNKDVIEAAAVSHGKASSSTGHWIYPGTVLKMPGTTSVSSNTFDSISSQIQNIG